MTRAVTPVPDGRGGCVVHRRDHDGPKARVPPVRQLYLRCRFRAVAVFRSQSIGRS